MPKAVLSTGGQGFVCPMCSLNVRNNDPVKVRALWDMHVMSHRDNLICGVEAMLARCTP